MNSLAHHSAKYERGTNAIYLCLPVNTAGAKRPAGLGSTAPGANRMGNRQQRLATGTADKATFPATADTPLRKKQVKCCPLEFAYLREHICHL